MMPLIAPVGASSFVRSASAGFSTSVIAHGMVFGQPCATVTRRCCPGGAEKAGLGRGDRSVGVVMDDGAYGLGETSEPLLVAIRALAHATKPAIPSTTMAATARDRGTGLASVERLHAGVGV